MESTSSSSSSSDEDNGLFFNMYSTLLRLNYDNDDDDGAESSNTRVTLLGGAGTGKPFRKKPRKINENAATAGDQRRRDHMGSPWSTRYFS